MTEAAACRLLRLGDCFDLLPDMKPRSVAAVVTDPPFGLEFEPEQLAKRRRGGGGLWRIPPALGGSVRAPVPRFTALTGEERGRVANFFSLWAEHTERVLVPGAHVFVASNSYLSQLVFAAIAARLEFRGEVVRVVRTLRGGDRPKGAEAEFSGVCALPRGCFEPWGLFRKPLEGTVAQNLRKWGTGGLRRLPDGNPFADLILSERTPTREKALCPHPSLKPQRFMRQLVYAALPLGEGLVLDPFAGGGATIAAAVHHSYEALGFERDTRFYRLAVKAVPELAKIHFPGASVVTTSALMETSSRTSL